MTSKKGATAHRYCDRANEAFRDNDDAPSERLVERNERKRSDMRYEVLGSAVVGSARLIIIPQTCFEPHEITVPRVIATLIKVVNTGEGGRELTLAHPGGTCLHDED
jgi:hypothetical protein